MKPGPAIDYPVRDGRPLGETDQHRQELTDYAVGVLARHFRGDPGVYVSGNNFVYWVEGDPKAVVSPDTYVVRGVAPGLRDTFKVWAEGGHRPCFALEITSRSTRREDMNTKLRRYRDELQVPEYFLFDPRREWVEEGLRGYVLEPSGVYRQLATNDRGRLPSRELGLELGLVEGHLRFFLPGGAEPLPTEAERAEQARLRAEEAEFRVEQARLRAEQERLRAEELEAEVRRLRGLLPPD